MLHTETVADGTLALIKKLSSDDAFREFNLVGGTALALQIGHRISVDIDLFSNKPFDAGVLTEHLSKNYPVERIESQVNGAAAIIDGVKIDVLSHQYNPVKPPLNNEGIRMASLDDIAAMKINAIYNIGTRHKDFLDIYYLLEHRSMNEMLNAYSIKYPDANPAIAGMALGFHDEVEQDKNIKQLREVVAWSDISNKIKDALKKPDLLFKIDKVQKVVKPKLRKSRKR